MRKPKLALPPVPDFTPATEREAQLLRDYKRARELAAEMLDVIAALHTSLHNETKDYAIDASPWRPLHVLEIAEKVVAQASAGQ